MAPWDLRAPSTSSTPVASAAASSVIARRVAQGQVGAVVGVERPLGGPVERHLQDIARLDLIMGQSVST